MIEILGDIAIVALTQGFSAVIDASDVEAVSAHRWRATNRDPAITYAISSTGGWMHRFLLNPPADLEVDHRDLNRLNNRRSNLRIATVAQNRRNTPAPNVPKTTPYKGVSVAAWVIKNRYRAQIRCDGRIRVLGYFATAEEAALAYDTAAKQYSGEFARLNFPDGYVITSHGLHDATGVDPCRAKVLGEMRQ